MLKEERGCALDEKRPEPGTPVDVRRRADRAEAHAGRERRRPRGRPPPRADGSGAYPRQAPGAAATPAAQRRWRCTSALPADATRADRRAGDGTPGADDTPPGDARACAGGRPLPRRRRVGAIDACGASSWPGQAAPARAPCPPAAVVLPPKPVTALRRRLDVRGVTPQGSDGAGLAGPVAAARGAGAGAAKRSRAVQPKQRCTVGVGRRRSAVAIQRWYRGDDLLEYQDCDRAVADRQAVFGAAASAGVLARACCRESLRRVSCAPPACREGRRRAPQC